MVERTPFVSGHGEDGNRDERDLAGFDDRP